MQADQAGTGPVASWWPGAQYVTWVGIDGYYYRSVRYLRQRLRHHHRPGPGVHRISRCCCRRRPSGPTAGQFAKIQDLFHGMAAYKTLGLVWFDKDLSGSGIDRQDWRIEDNFPAADSFRASVRTELAPNPPAG